LILLCDFFPGYHNGRLERAAVIISDHQQFDASPLHDRCSWGILYSKLFLLPEGSSMLGDPPPELGHPERYLWQKVHICLAEDVRVFFDDDDLVVDLFGRYAPSVQVYQSMAPFRWP
jgi:hypothetical protein